MKKKLFIGIAAVLIVLFTAVNIKPALKCMSDVFWSAAAKQLDKEEAEREKRIEQGLPVAGKDTVLIWHDMYQILHCNDEYDLTIDTKDVSDQIIGKIKKHKVAEKKLYILSDEGYAIIDENNICRIFITVPDEDFVSGYSEDEDGNRIYFSRKVEHQNIKYLTSYDQFEKSEKKVFEKMEKKIVTDGK